MNKVDKLCKLSQKGYASSMVVTNRNKKARVDGLSTRCCDVHACCATSFFVCNYHMYCRVFREIRRHLAAGLYYGSLFERLFSCGGTVELFEPSTSVLLRCSDINFFHVPYPSHTLYFPSAVLILSPMRRRRRRRQHFQVQTS